MVPGILGDLNPLLPGAPGELNLFGLAVSLVLLVFQWVCVVFNGFACCFNDLLAFSFVLLASLFFGPQGVVQRGCARISLLKTGVSATPQAI